MNYNPYDLLSIKMAGCLTHARVLALDSTITDERNSKNINGQYVVPKTAITSCPSCAQPVELTLYLGQPPFSTVEATCTHCEVAPIKESSFIDPVARGRIALSQLKRSAAVTTKVQNEADLGLKLEKFQRIVDKSVETEENFTVDTVGDKDTKPKRPKPKKKSNEDNIG